jgi:hypothetical protein
MDDAKYGTEDSRGYWQPKGRISYGPVFEWPPKPKVLLKWFFGFPGYLFPWNVIYAVAAVGIWVYLTPALETMRTFSFSWAGLILVRNLTLALSVYGAWHMWLYVWRKQNNDFKYNKSWPKERSSIFLFNNQTYDNMFWTLVSGVTVWTIYEVLLFWAYANNYATLINPSEHPVLFVALFFLVPFVHEVGFYFAHRSSLFALAAAVSRRTQTTPQKCQPRALVRTLYAPFGAYNLFLNDITVFCNPGSSNAYDQSCIASWTCSSAGPYGF